MSPPCSASASACSRSGADEPEPIAPPGQPMAIETIGCHAAATLLSDPANDQPVMVFQL